MTKPRKPIPRVSKRQAQVNAGYEKVKRIWWQEQVKKTTLQYPRCEVCAWRRAEKTPHHVLPRSVRPDLIADANNFLRICTDCHDWVHRHPHKAREKGFMGRSTDSLEELKQIRERF
jgi:hypothetical protein